MILHAQLLGCYLMTSLRLAGMTPADTSFKSADHSWFQKYKCNMHSLPCEVNLDVQIMASSAAVVPMKKHNPSPTWLSSPDLPTWASLFMTAELTISTVATLEQNTSKSRPCILGNISGMHASQIQCHDPHVITTVTRYAHAESFEKQTPMSWYDFL